MMNPDVLRDYLEVLREEGVSQFSCPDFSVTLLATKPADDDDDTTDAIKDAAAAAKVPSAARGLFGDPRLWGPNGPPQFPGSERSTPTHAPTHDDDEF